MPIGSKSLLFGVHQFLLHPLFVLRAWIRLYGWPNGRELVAIVMHDWGYWGSPDMDGEEGELHCWRSGTLAENLRLGDDIAEEVYLHSRHFAKRVGKPASRLCYADKLSHIYYPVWLYLLLARLTGEILEYRLNSAKVGFFPLEGSDRDWFLKLRDHMAAVGLQQDAAAMMYMR